MFSLQTIFGQGKQFYALFNEAADAAYDSTKALHAMLKERERRPSIRRRPVSRSRFQGTKRPLSCIRWDEIEEGAPRVSGKRPRRA